MAHHCHDNIKQKQILGFKVLRASRLASVVSHISLSSVRHVIGLKVNSIRFSTELSRSVRSCTEVRELIKVKFFDKR